MPVRFLFVVLCLASCTRRTPPMATAADAERANVELAQLERGRSLVLAKCSSCHQPPLPADHTALDWPSKIGEMAERSKLDAEQRRMIEQYLVVMSNAAPPAAKPR